VTFAEIHRVIEAKAKPFADAERAAEAMRQWAATLGTRGQRVRAAMANLDEGNVTEAAGYVRTSLSEFDALLVTLQAALRELHKSDLLQSGGAE
jgi:hypothetical protein